MPLELPDGTIIPLQSVARVYEAAGPNTINREDGRRRIVRELSNRSASDD